MLFTIIYSIKKIEMNIKYEELKNQIDILISNQKNCCEIGCSFCCYQTVEIAEIEVQTLKKSIEGLNRETKVKIAENLNTYWDFYNKHISTDQIQHLKDVNKTFLKLPLSEKTKCPLLIDNMCSIYSDRPLTCRTQIVESKPELCEKDAFRDASKPALKIKGYMSVRLRELDELKMNLLPFIVSEVIDKKRSLPIKYGTKLN